MKAIAIGVSSFTIAIKQSCFFYCLVRSFQSILHQALAAFLVKCLFHISFPSFTTLR